MALYKRPSVTNLRTQLLVKGQKAPTRKSLVERGVVRPRSRPSSLEVDPLARLSGLAGSIVREADQAEKRRTKRKATLSSGSLEETNANLRAKLESKSDEDIIDVSPSAEAPDQEFVNKDVIDVSPSAEAADQEFVKVTIPEYPEDLSPKKIQSIIKREAKLRNISATSALAIYKAEGFNSYQSSITEGSQKKVGGREASYGPFQLYVGGGLGNEYEEQTGRSLSLDNTLEGITKQIQFALDKAAEGKSWKPWSGHKAAGLDPTEGLNNAKPIFNWRENS